MKRGRLIAAGLLSLAAACAGSGQGSGRVGAGGRDMILPDQIAASTAVDAYSLVQSLRPHWLRVRDNARGAEVQVATRNGEGEASTGQGYEAGSVNVYLNNARMGPVDALRQIPLAGVRYIQYFTPAQANLRWGAGNANGAILVSTEDLPRP